MRKLDADSTLALKRPHEPGTFGSMGSDLEKVIVMLYVDDVARSLDFYRRVGLAVAFDAGSYAELSWGTLQLGLRNRENARTQFGDAVALTRAPALHQITVVVDRVDDVAAKLTVHGVELLQEPMDQAWGMRSATFLDPDGHLWEVCSSLD